MGLSGAAFALVEGAAAALQAQAIGPMLERLHGAGRGGPKEQAKQGKGARGELIVEELSARQLKAAAAVLCVVGGGKMEKKPEGKGRGRRGNRGRGKRTEQEPKESGSQVEQDARQALEQLLSSCEVLVEGESDSEEEEWMKGEVGTGEELVIDINDLLTVEESPGVPMWLCAPWIVGNLQSVSRARALGLLRSSLFSDRPNESWPSLCAGWDRAGLGSRKGSKGGTESAEAQIQMLDWLVRYGSGGNGYGTCVRWVEGEREWAVGRLIEAKKGGLQVAVDSAFEGGQSLTGQRRGVVSVGDFKSVGAWVEYARESSRKGGGAGEGEMWECLHVGAWSLRELAEGLSIELVEGSLNSESAARTGDMASDEIEAPGEGVGKEARERMAKQVRINELVVLEKAAEWCRDAADVHARAAS